MKVPTGTRPLPDPPEGPDPNGMIIGCYSLHLYCANDGRFGDFTGRSQRDAEQAARAAGWKLRPRVVCPKCQKAAQ